VSCAIVTGGASGIGAAIVERLRREGHEVEVLDLTTGFDVSEPEHWERVGPVDVACLNAGVLGAGPDPAELDLDRYHRAVAVNVDGVVLGVRRLARAMAPGGRIVCTASLAGLTAYPGDPVYVATKHAVVGFVRATAPVLAERGLTIDAVCPGFADTTLVGADLRRTLAAAGFPLLTADEVAEAVWHLLATEGTGRALVVQPGREPVEFRFPNVPGARSGQGEPLGAPPPSGGY
jgi:NAD(P)-dependent dehydrogenase (short-subunit alcohol dehydrogenase family)